MARREHLGEFEHIVLLAVLRLGEDAYGVPIRSRSNAHRPLAHGRCAVPDARSTRGQRLRDLFVRRSDPRTWRPIQALFRIRPLGLRTLRASRDALAAMWEGLEPLVTRGS